MKVYALNPKTNTVVKATLRRPVEDLTSKDLNVPAYYHVKRQTVSGRIVLGNINHFAELHFVPN